MKQRKLRWKKKKPKKSNKWRTMGGKINAGTENTEEKDEGIGKTTSGILA
jgi:hypothetical protein